jgi:hypothetical protein
MPLRRNAHPLDQIHGSVHREQLASMVMGKTWPALVHKLYVTLPSATLVLISHATPAETNTSLAGVPIGRPKAPKLVRLASER